MTQTLELQIETKWGWQTLNRRQVGEKLYVECLAELYELRAEWRAAQFPKDSFRILGTSGRKERVIVKPEGGGRM